MTADVRLYDSDGTTELGPGNPFTFAGVVLGSRSTAKTIYAINDLAAAGADDAVDYAIEVLERTVGETTWRAAGREIVDGRHIEARIIAGTGGLTTATTSWIPLGSGRRLPLPVMESEQGVEIELAASPPLGTTAAETELYFRVVRGPVENLGRGLTEISGDGGYLGLGDGLATALLHAGDVVQNPGGADAFVQVPDVGAIREGVPWVELEQLVEFDQNDGDAVVLAAGNAYWGLVYAGDGGAGIAKGPQGVDPVAESARPAIPELAKPLAWVYVDDSGVITDADITQAWELDGERVAVVAGLTVGVGAVPRLIDNRWIVHQRRESATLPDDSTVHLWRLPDGSLSTTTDASRPEPRARLLAEAVTAAGAITSLVERPRWIPSPRWIRFRFDVALTGSPVVYAHWPSDREGYLAPIPGLVEAIVVDAGAGASGSSEWDIAVAEDGAPATWSSIFGGAGEGRPSVPFDTTTRRSSGALPSTLVIPPRSLLRCTLTAEVDASHPAGAVVSLPVWEV